MAAPAYQTQFEESRKEAASRAAIRNAQFATGLKKAPALGAALVGDFLATTGNAAKELYNRSYVAKSKGSRLPLTPYQPARPQVADTRMASAQKREIYPEPDPLRVVDRSKLTEPDPLPIVDKARLAPGNMDSYRAAIREDIAKVAQGGKPYWKTEPVATATTPATVIRDAPAPKTATAPAPVTTPVDRTQRRILYANQLQEAARKGELNAKLASAADYDLTEAEIEGYLQKHKLRDYDAQARRQIEAPIGGNTMLSQRRSLQRPGTALIRTGVPALVAEGKAMNAEGPGVRTQAHRQAEDEGVEMAARARADLLAAMTDDEWKAAKKARRNR